MENWTCWILLILAIVCALFADEFDTYAKADKKLKKVIIVFSVGTALISAISILASLLA